MQWPVKPAVADAAEAEYRENLAYACDKAAPTWEFASLIEPMNQRDAPNYHVTTIEQGIETIRRWVLDNLKLMFDCYHTQIMQGDLTERLREAMPYIGHIQFASVPERNEPDRGEVNYPNLFAALMRWAGRVIGALNTGPSSTTDEGLSWIGS